MFLRDGILLGTANSIMKQVTIMFMKLLGLWFWGEKRKRGWTVWWIHNMSEIKILIKYLDMGNTKVICGVSRAVFMINEEVLMLPSTSRWQQYHSLHKCSPVDYAFAMGGQRWMEALFWIRQLEAKERRKENKCSFSHRFSSRNSYYCYSVFIQTSIKSLFFLPDRTLLFSKHEKNEVCLRTAKNILVIKNQEHILRLHAT